MKKLFNVITLLIVFFCFTNNVYAFELSEIKSDKVILINLNDDKVIYDKKSEVKSSIASLTKIMTVYVAIENIDDLKEKVTITNEMIRPITWDVSTAGFKVGDKVTYEDLLYGAMLPSGADATNALAISIAGSFDAYVELMNNKASELKLLNTHYGNVTGLDDEDGYSTAEDVSKLLKTALENDIFYKIYTSKTYTATNGLKMKNATLRYNNIKDIDLIHGTKTGYTTNAQLCMSSITEIDDTKYLLITLGANSKEKKPYQMTDHVGIYSYFSSNYSYKEIINSEKEITKVKTINTKEKEVSIVSTKNIELYLKNDIDLEKITYEFIQSGDISYKTKQGDIVGSIKIFYDKNELAVSTATINEELHFSIFAYLTNNPVIIAIIVLFILTLFIKIKSKKKRVRK